MIGWFALLLHAALVALAAPLLDGLLQQATARRQHRAGPPLLQPWRDLVRQWRKPPLRPAGASFVVSIAPPLALGAAITAALLVPSFGVGMATSGTADLIVVAGLLALSRLAPALAAHDAGAVLAGANVAAARLPTEPLLLLVALAATLLSGSTNLDATALRDGLPGLRLPGTLAGLALLATIANEPRTPAIFSGRDLALVTAAGQLRRVASLSLVAAIGFPLGLASSGSGPDAWLVGAAFWILKLGVLGVLGVLASLLTPHRALLPAAALLALIAAVIIGVQGRV